MQNNAALFQRVGNNLTQRVMNTFSEKKQSCARQRDTATMLIRTRSKFFDIAHLFLMQTDCYSERDFNSTTVPPVQAISNTTKLTLKGHRIDTILALSLRALWLFYQSARTLCIAFFIFRISLFPIKISNRGRFSK